jgi:hypothetical protein
MMAVCLMAAGCAALDPSATTRPTTGPSTAPETPMEVTIHSDGPQDARHSIEAVVQLTIYIVDLPAGTIAADAAFWSRVDEQAVGPAVAEQLACDGIRCGVASKSQGAFFSRYFDTQPDRIKRQMVAGVHAETVAIDLTKQVPSQTLFYLDDHHHLIGRTYEDCTNSLSLAFGPTPRVPGSVRMTLCPTIKRTRKTIAYTATDGEVDQTTPVVDSLYGVSFTADVPGDSLLVIAPNKEADPATSLGRAFLTRDESAERREQVIVIVPTFLSADGTTVIKSLGK